MGGARERADSTHRGAMQALRPDWCLAGHEARGCENEAEELSSGGKSLSGTTRRVLSTVAAGDDSKVFFRLPPAVCPVRVCWRKDSCLRTVRPCAVERALGAHSGAMPRTEYQGAHGYAVALDSIDKFDASCCFHSNWGHLLSVTLVAVHLAGASLKDDRSGFHDDAPEFSAYWSPRPLSAAITKYMPCTPAIARLRGYTIMRIAAVCNSRRCCVSLFMWKRNLVCSCRGDMIFSCL